MTFDSKLDVVHLLVIVRQVINDVCLGGELQELSAVRRNKVLLQAVSVPPVILWLIQEKLLLFNSSEFGHLLLSSRNICFFVIFMLGDTWVK